MALMVGSLYDALRSANVDDEKARRAAEEVADYQSQFHGFEKELSALRGDVGLLRWMVGFNLAFSAAMLFRMFA